MLFPSASEVNGVWSIVAQHTANNELGVAAKVAPRDPTGELNGVRRPQRLICIYTKDFFDVEDIRRVVLKLRDLGLVETNGRPIYYKPGKPNCPYSDGHALMLIWIDAYTYLDIKNPNQWDIKPSLYNSGELLKQAPAPVKRTLDAFFHKDEYTRYWKEMED